MICFYKQIGDCGSVEPLEEFTVAGDCHLGELELSVRSYNCLTNAGIKTVRDLYFMSDKELLKIKNFYKKSLNNTKGALADFLLNGYIRR